MFKKGDKVILKKNHYAYSLYPNREFVVVHLSTVDDIITIRGLNSIFGLYATSATIELVSKMFLYCEHCDLYMTESDPIECPECGRNMVKEKDEKRR